MRIFKPIIYTLASAVLLIMIILGGGLAYTWYVGQNSNVDDASIATPVDSAPTPVAKPTKLAANANVGASVQTLTSPVAPGANASISVKTNPGSKCTIEVVYDGTASADSGLSPKDADEYGVVSWTWTVDASAPLGVWPVEVTCVYGDKSAVVKGDLVVES